MEEIKAFRWSLEAIDCFCSHKLLASENILSGCTDVDGADSYFLEYLWFRNL